MTEPLIVRAASAGWTPEQLALDALWQEGVQAAAARYRELRRCWNCHAPWTEAGECPTKGCRGPGSGFERPTPPPPERPCLGCGTPTAGRAIGALTPGVTDLERWAWCPRCEEERNRAQAHAITHRKGTT